MLDGEEMDAAPRKSLFTGEPCYFMWSNPNKTDSDGDGYDDYFEVKDETYPPSNPMYNDIKIYSLSEEFVEVGCAGECVWVGKNGATLSFGGAQSWFQYEGDYQNMIIEEMGCGLISVADKLLYLSKINSKYDTDLTKSVIQKDKFVTNFENKAETIYCYDYKSYLKYVTELNSSYFKTHKNGWLGTSLASAWNKYMEKINGNLHASWGCSVKNILPRIEEMLSNDIPVTLSIGPKFKNRDSLKLYLDINGNFANDRTQNHYVTVTGLREDNITKQVWLEVSSWGIRYYIDYKEYLEYILAHVQIAVTSNILYMYEGN